MKYKVRCSSIHKIFDGCGKVRNKLEWTDLDKVTESHIKLFIEIYNSQNGFVPCEVVTKDLQNGNDLEPISKDMVRSVLNIDLLDGQQIENDYITGCCDLVNKSAIYDTKTSTDKNVFDLKKFKEIEVDYIFQQNGYKLLYGVEYIYIANTLVTPTEVDIIDMARKVGWIKKWGDLESEAYQDKLRMSYFYDHIPIKERVSIRKVPIIENFEEMLEYRVTKLNNWIKENLE